MALTQKQERVVKMLDEIKAELTHGLAKVAKDAGHTAEKTDFVIKIEGFKSDARKSESGLHGLYARIKAYVEPLLKRISEERSDNVKSVLHRMDLAISGRKK